MLEDATLEYQDTTKHATNAFLLALISFAQRIGCLDLLQQVEVPMKEVVHTVHEKIVTLLLSYASGCPSSHALEQQLRPQQLAAQALAIPAFAGCRSRRRVRWQILGRSCLRTATRRCARS